MNTYPEYSAVWFEIPARGMARSREFYAAVLQDHLGDDDIRSHRKARATGGVYAGVERDHADDVWPGKTGSTIHLAAPLPIETALERVGENGGTITFPLSAIPTGRFAQCADPDGNPFGLFAR